MEQIVQVSAQGLMLLEVHSRHARIRYVNPAYEHLSGYTLKELQGNTWCTHFDGECEFSEDDQLTHLLTGGLPTVQTFSFLRKDGTVWESQVHLSRVGTSGGDTILVLAQHFPVGMQIAVEAVEPRPSVVKGTVGNGSTGTATGMLSPDQFDALLTRNLAIARRRQWKIVIFAFEIREFQAYCDALGSLAADACARMIGTQISRTFSQDGILKSRLDAATFVVAVHEPWPDTPDSLALKVAEKVDLLRLPNPRGRISRHLEVASGHIEVDGDKCTEGAAELIHRTRSLLAGELTPGLAVARQARPVAV